LFDKQLIGEADSLFEPDISSFLKIVQADEVLFYRIVAIK